MVDATTAIALGGVVVSLIVGLLTFFASRRSNSNSRALGDLEARDRLIDQLQERVDQLDRQVEASDRQLGVLRHELTDSHNETDDLHQEITSLRRHYREALGQIDDHVAHTTHQEALIESLRLQLPKDQQ